MERIAGRRISFNRADGVVAEGSAGGTKMRVEMLSSKPPPRNRGELINWLIDVGGYHSYLEIGCAKNRTFDAIGAPHKVGIDSREGGTLRLTSDAFFRVNRERFDIVFIDGLHLREQVIRDVNHALKCLRQDGCIVLHDCLPTDRRHQQRTPPRGAAAWTGDVWKAVIHFRRQPNCDTAVLDADWGLGVMFKRPNSDRLSAAITCDWDAYCAQRDRLLRVVDFSGLRRFVSRSTGVGKGPHSIPTQGDMVLARTRQVTS